MTNDFTEVNSFEPFEQKWRAEGILRFVTIKTSGYH